MWRGAAGHGLPIRWGPVVRCVVERLHNRDNGFCCMDMPNHHYNCIFGRKRLDWILAEFVKSKYRRSLGGKLSTRRQPLIHLGMSAIAARRDTPFQDWPSAWFHAVSVCGTLRPRFRNRYPLPLVMGACNSAASPANHSTPPNGVQGSETNLLVESRKWPESMWYSLYLYLVLAWCVVDATRTQTVDAPLALMNTFPSDEPWPSDFVYFAGHAPVTHWLSCSKRAGSG
jgi:hypothetical protein